MKVFNNEKKRRLVLEGYNALLKGWGVPYEEKDVTNPYGTTHLVCVGDPSAEPLLLLHGVGDNAAVMWIRNIQALSAHFYCLALDTIGGPGKSVPGPEYRKGFSQQAWLDSVLDALNIKECCVAGVSNGAAMAFAYAAYKPERVRKLVCIEGGIVQDTSQAWKTMMKAFPEALFPTEANVRKLLVKFAHPREGFFDNNPDIASHMVTVMQANNRMAMGYQSPWVYDAQKAEPLRNKALFLLGEYSAGATPDYAAMLDREGFAHQTILDAGHGANMEQPEAVNEALLNFLLAN